MDSYFSLVNVVTAAIFVMFLNRKYRSHHENKTTASSSCLVSPPTSLPSHNWKHHVFPSFHGPDVRKAFLSHILSKLRSKGINAFIDNDIERSTTIGHELKEAIRGSRIAIVLLSKNYASSTWCLNELVEIMKCREELGQTVMSLFYEVDPTDVKKQTGNFGKVFRETCKGKTKEDIGRWKHALTEVAQIAGYHSTNWENDAEMIEEIASDVSNKLNNSTPSSDFDGLVGMESRMRKMGPLLRLDSAEVRTIGILGPSGIGKTTIARYLFNRLSPDFQLSVFMESLKTIPACSDNYKVKLDLQKQLMAQLTNEVGIKIPHLGIPKDRLKDKKVLVVLDDVNRSIQPEAMAKETWFGPGSRIIITTQDQKILTAGGIEHIYRVDLPSGDEALEMFCMYAFDQKSPPDGFTELALEVTRLVGKLPLGLWVMGSYFRGMCKEDWRKALPSLKTRLDPDGEIENILKFSYDALCDDDKRLFLHIACFFNYELIYTVEGCLASCFLDVTQGLHILFEKSLIYINSGREIEMHKLLVQLGRKIVREQSVSEPGKRQFLDDAIDIRDVLSDDKPGSNSVLGINLNENITCTSGIAFERLSNLQFLRINGDGINPQSLNSVYGKLRFLRWWKFPMPCFPSSLNPKFLVKLDMWESKLEKLWEGTQPLSNLKWMNLSDSKSLKELPDMSSATNLYYLDLSNCESLVKLPSSIGNAINLKYLNLRCCSSLVELPPSMRNLRRFSRLELEGCSKLEVLLDNINLESLEYLNLSDCLSLKELPSSIGNAINLQKLDLSFCLNLVELPSSMRNLSRLLELKLEYCSKLEVLLDNINLESLEELNLSGCSLLKSYPESSTNVQDLNPSRTTVTKAPSSMRSWPLLSKFEMCEIQELGPWIGRISRLRRLVISGMENLVSLPQLPYSVVELDAENCESLERLDCSFRNPGIRLNFRNCFKLNQEAKYLIIQTPTNQFAISPGREVPQCFTYRSSGGTLTVKLNQSTSTKFKACIICANDEVVNGSNRVSCSITSNENALTCYKNIGQIFPGNMYIFEVEAEEVTSTELVFEFDIYSYDINVKWEIKECGILQFLEAPHADEHYVSGDEDYGSSDEHYESVDEDFGSGYEHYESVRDGDEDSKPLDIEI